MNVQVPSTWRRILAYSLDASILALCFLPVWLQVWGHFVLTSEVAVELRWVAAALVLRLFYSWLFLFFLGGTLGKLLLGLRVVPRVDVSSSLGLFQSFLRVLTDGLSLFLGLAPRALALLRLDRTHVSDWVAETRVVQLSKQSSWMRRHWMLALLVIWMSFFEQFGRVYQLVQIMEVHQGRIVFPMR